MEVSYLSRVQFCIILFTLLFSRALLAVKLSKVEQEKKVVDTLCRYKDIKLEKNINPYFLSRLPAHKLITILNEFKKEEGECVNIEKIGKNNYLYNTEKSQRAMQLYLDKNLKIRGLWFGNATSFNEKLSLVLKKLKKLQGIKAISLIKNNKISLLSLNSDKALAVGSSSNLHLLSLLNSKVRKTKLKWTSRVLIKEKLKSLPSGRLHNWNAGSPLTLQSMATMMIAYSDNTASDHLHSLIGRRSLEKSSTRNRPYLTTYEYFKLRGEQIEKYGNENIKGKRSLLKKIKISKRIKIDMIDRPYLLDKIGWFFSTKELCSKIYEIKDLSFISINPGLTQKDMWSSSAFVGGRSPGVLQYTQLLQSKKSKDYYCLSITWNNADGNIDSTKIDAIVGRIIPKIK